MPLAKERGMLALTDMELSRFCEDFSAGRAYNAWDVLGSRLTENGSLFRVWAPRAARVCVAGDFNDWNGESLPMDRRSGGIWELFVPGVKAASTYKYIITTTDCRVLWKADPYARFSELRPSSASRIWDDGGYPWGDEKWLKHRRKNKVYNNPLSIYEVHLGSWAQGENGSYLSYRQAAEKLIPYVKELGFTHIEFMPLTEYPYDASWGYQCTGYFAATSRYGSPQDLMYLIDACHRAGLGVIMDWVPAHFPKDPHGLVEFDGWRLYECDDPVMAEHPSWGTRIFDYSKGEVRSFLISSALYWLRQYHVDGLRVDAVASMLYLDYDRQGTPWRPNKYGGNGNLDAVAFMQDLNRACFAFDDSILMIAEESTAWPKVTAPVEAGGLGFNLKWNMGWMNDTQRYLKTDPIYRSHRHDDLTFSLVYAFSENYVLPLSHDEVVHLKGSMACKAPGSREQRFATVRTFWAYMIAHPGKNLMFMGAELGQETEWNFAASLPWELLDRPEHKALWDYFAEANRYYLSCRQLWAEDFSEKGFSWLCSDAKNNNVLAFLRRCRAGRKIIFICSFSGGENPSFRLGVPAPGVYTVDFSTDEVRFGGTGRLTEGASFISEPIPYHRQKHSILIDIPPLTAIFLKYSAPESPLVKELITNTETRKSKTNPKEAEI